MLELMSDHKIIKNLFLEDTVACIKPKGSQREI